jgi:hypothetical protein
LQEPVQLAVYKPAEPVKVAADRSGLKPYWGKPAVRNFREVRGNVLHGLVTICHAARKGGYTGSHWPTQWRASFLLNGKTSHITAAAQKGMFTSNLLPRAIQLVAFPPSSAQISHLNLPLSICSRRNWLIHASTGAPVVPRGGPTFGVGHA